MKENPQPSLETIYKSPPLVHGDGDHCWKISLECARYIHDHVATGSSTIETGCGLSTVIFALKGATHTCIVPNIEEVHRLKSYCSELGISLDSVSFKIERSQYLLPSMSHKSYDFVFIDGCHSFPSPFIDWYFIEPHLKLGGMLVIDDIHLWTGKVLRDFLQEDPHWSFLKEFPARSVVFQKQHEGSTDIAWNDQPYVYSRSSVTKPRLALEHIKHKAKEIRSWFTRSSGPPHRVQS